MPGRQSTGPAPSKKPKPRNKIKKRSLNALAIATKQNPERTKLPQSRLGEAQGTEKQRNNQFESSGFNGKETTRRGAKGKQRADDSEVEEGSDSEGNEWRIGQVDSDDDSELDSDEAFGESDEERFEGFVFRGSTSGDKNKGLSKRQQRSSGGGLNQEINLDEDGDNNELDEDEGSLSDLGEDAVDLADMLDESEEDENQMKNSKKRKSGTGESNNVDEENISYDSSQDESSALSLSDSEDEGNDPVKLSALQDLVSSIQPEPGLEHPSKRRRINDAHESSTPSEFGISSTQKLTLADLQSTVTDPRLKSSLKLLDPAKAKKRSGKRDGIPGKLDVPLEKRQQDPLDRAAAYKMAKEQLKKWEDTVIHNRRADHLMFPLPDPTRDVVSSNTRMHPTSTVNPQNDLERAIQEISEISGLAPANNGKSEEEQIAAFEELQTNKMPLEEVQARRAELRKVRDLMFFEEKRAKRIKSIKSKRYRREHRRDLKKREQGERDALTAAGGENSDEDREEHDRRRAMARMGAKSRDSKFARGMKASGRAEWDADARSSVLEKAKSEEDLRRRIEGKSVRGDDDTFSELSSSGEDNEDDEEDDDRALGNRMRSMAHDLHSQQTEDSVGSRLFSMPFMQKADAARKAQNDADQRRFQRELDGEETSSDEEEGSGTARREYGPNSERTASQQAIKGMQSELEEGQSDSEVEEKAAQDAPLEDAEDDIEIVLGNGNGAKASSQEHRPLSRLANSNHLKHRSEDGQNEIEDQPWLRPMDSKTRSRQKQQQVNNAPATILNTFPDQDPPQPNSSPAKPQPLKSILKKPTSKPTQTPPSNPEKWKTVTMDGPRPETTTSDSESESESASLPFALRNQALAQRVFAGDDVVPSFEKEKRQTILDEGEKIIDHTLPGWGSWTGEGISKKAAARNAGRFMSKEEGIKEERRKDSKLKGVIINEKRIKKNIKYLANVLPHPFETRLQYERSLRLPVGPEWTTKETFQDATKPRVMIKQGVIAPMSRPLL